VPYGPGSATTASLKLGSQGDEVIKLQTRLIDLGMLAGEADGTYGQATKQSVTDLQNYLVSKGYEIAVDGIAGPATQALLYDDQATWGAGELKLGRTGYMVTMLQTQLYAMGFLNDLPDGRFGAGTEAALRAFQARMVELGYKGAAQTGVADAATRAALYANALALPTPDSYDAKRPQDLQPGNLWSRACVLIDADTGEVLFEKNGDQKMYPASTTKIMTLLVALERAKLSKKVTIPAEAAQVPSDSSLVPVRVGEQMTMADLLYGMFIRSGNDASNAVAVACGGSIDRFVAAMNAKAEELGMAGTRFANAHGYHDADHYTTARDMAVLTAAALKNADFRKIASARTYTMAATAKRGELALTKNYSILDPSSSYYYDGAFGIKTGYTSAAGQCYVGAAQRDGRTLIAVVLRCGMYRSDKWTDAARLFNYGFAA
ncbi:MAG: hypothetical protein GX558_00145, partial [Clostridiales bacterium]|nr:hypothetical protein [Clostridiales bacterium]